MDGERKKSKIDVTSVIAIFTGRLNGKPLRFLRQIGDQNRFEVWRQLCQLSTPRTGSRAISILAALMGFPSFTTKDGPLLDQVLGLERMRAEYVCPSGIDIPDDIMLSVLVRSLPKAFQQHVQLQLNESST